MNSPWHAERTGKAARRLAAGALFFFAGLAAAAGPPRSIELRPTGLEATAAGRQLLGYIVSCALERDVEAVAVVEGRTHRFRGAEALAPGWAHRAMSLQEERWVSACLLARTNAFGESLPIYLHRGTVPATPRQREREGAARFTLFEGMFFGNLFAQPPVGYACHAPGNAAAPGGILARRACARAAAGELSVCGIRVTGPCDAPQALEAGGRRWSEVMQVWLRPD